jgi:hypothetical protein
MCVEKEEKLETKMYEETTKYFLHRRKNKIQAVKARPQRRDLGRLCM